MHCKARQLYASQDTAASRQSATHDGLATLALAGASGRGGSDYDSDIEGQCLGHTHTYYYNVSSCHRHGPGGPGRVVRAGLRPQGGSDDSRVSAHFQ
jgi:hypothetical protein